MRREDVERSISQLDEELRDALLLSTEYTCAESADRLGITTDELVKRIDNAKREIVMELLGDWRDPGSRFVIDMHIDTAAMNMQRRRRGVLNRVRQWLERLVEQTRVQPWRSGLVPVGSFAVIALAVATSYLYLFDEASVAPDHVVVREVEAGAADDAQQEVERGVVGVAAVEQAVEQRGVGVTGTGRPAPAQRRAEFDDTGTGGRIFLTGVEASSSCGQLEMLDPPEMLLDWQQACGEEIYSRRNDFEEQHEKLEGASRQLETTWREAETWLEAQERQLDIQERQLEFEERLQEIQVRRRELEGRRRELEGRRRELEGRRRAAEDENVDLERERERIEERFRGMQRDSEYRRAFGSYVASWDKEYRQPLDQYSQGMEKYGEEIVRYVCGILQSREELADLAREYGGTIPPPRVPEALLQSAISCPDFETGDGRPVLVRH